MRKRRKRVEGRRRRSRKRKLNRERRLGSDEGGRSCGKKV